MFLALILTIFAIIWKSAKWISNFSFKIFIRDSRMMYRAIFSFLYLTQAKHRNLTVHQIFERNADKNPNKICFRFEDESWTYKEVQEKVNRVSNYFQRQGFAKGDHIGLMMENRVEYVCIWLGLAKIGVVPALINYNLRLTPLHHCLKAGFCKGIIYGGNLEGAIEELKEHEMLDSNFKLYSFWNHPSVFPNRLEAVDLSAALGESSPNPPILTSKVNFDDELFYIYTSGTTGLPKAAVIKHSRYFYGAIAFHYFSGLNSSDVIYAPLPLYHTNAGIFGTGQALLFGNTVAIGKKFSATRFWQECVQHEATVFQYIGEVCRYLLAQPVRREEKEHKIRLIFGNGLRPEIWTEFITRFNIPNVSEFYGSTEGNCNLMSFDNTVGAVGFLPRISSIFVKICLVRVDKDNGIILRDPATGLALRCAVDEPGELVGIIDKRSAHSDFMGYTDPEAQRKKIVCDVFRKGDRAFRSGDLLVKDKFGYFYFKDRQGDTFRWKGENVSTAEVENVVSKACELRDTAVYGVSVPGADGKAGMAAIVDPTRSLDLQGLAEKLTNELPAYARPIFIRILKDIEMTGTFKFKKVELQKEGFDISIVTDPLYFYLNGKYVPLDAQVYNLLITGKARV